MQYIVMNTNNKIMKKNNGKERRNVRKGWSRGREYWGCKR